MDNEINLKGCAVISLEEYSRLKEIEASKNEIISNQLQFMIDELIIKKATRIEYKGFILIRNPIDLTFTLQMPRGTPFNENI